MVFSADDEAMYTKHADELMAYAAVLVGPNDAYDLFAATIVGTFTSPRWPDVGNKRAYLYRALTNAAWKQRRAAQRRLSRELRSAEPDLFEPPAVEVEVLHALAALTMRERSVVFLTYWHDVPPDGIAASLEISRRSVERALTNARRKLEGLLS